MKLKRTIVAGALLLAMLAVWWAPVGASEAVDVRVLEVGWWSSRPGALAQPEGGFEVSATPTGDNQSIAALRLSISSSNVDSLQIRLDETASTGTQFGVLKLCSTVGVWAAANPGAMSNAPTPDCTVSAILTRTTDGLWLGDATELARNGGEVTLVVVPHYSPPSPATIGPGLVVTIGGGDLTATGSTATTSPTTEPTPTTGPNPFVFTPSDGGFAAVGGGSFGVPGGMIEPDFGSASPEPPVTQPPAEPIDDFVLDPVASEGDPPPPWIRLVLLAPLSAGFGVGTVRLRRLLDERGILTG